MLTNEILYANSPTAIKLHENKQNEINKTKTEMKTGLMIPTCL